MRPLKIAHRGAMAEAPENTRSAFDRAMDYGVDGIEFDVQITKDGIPVIYHDPMLQKINEIPKTTIPDFTLSELLKYDFGQWFSKVYQNEKILTLEETLRAYGKRTRLFIEIKSPPIPQTRSLYETLPALVVDSVRNCIPEDRMDNIHILAFDPGMLRAAFLKSQDIKYVLNLESPFSKNNPPNLEPLMLYGYGLEHTQLTRPFVDGLHDDGKKIFTYPCDMAADIQRARGLKVDGIMTNDPGGAPWREIF